VADVSSLPGVTGCATGRHGGYPELVTVVAVPVPNVPALGPPVTGPADGEERQ
jgi:hypothetical protein